MFSVAAVALAGCTDGRPATNPGRSSPAGPYTLKDLLSESPFYVAHRGSGDNWTEHSMEAYSQVINFGVKAIEVSVVATSDGVLVCHHDLNLLRLTGVDSLVSNKTYAELKDVRLNAREWLGPAAHLQPLTKLSDVLDAFAESYVIFLEDKQGTNTTRLLDMMDGYADSVNHLVWKQPATARQISAVKARGYKSWGYFMPDQESLFSALVSKFDYVGLHHRAPDNVFTELVNYGKPVICWEVHTRSMRDRLLKLNVQGMMCSNIPYVRTSNALANHDVFASGLRAAGDLPWTLDMGWDAQPTISADEASIRLDAGTLSSYVVGSLAPISRQLYSLHFEMRWPTIPLRPDQHAGVAFGLDNDSTFLARTAGSSSGYQLIVRPSGELVLLRCEAGQVNGSRLAVVQTAPVADNEWISFRVDVSPAAIRFARTDSVGWAGETDNQEFRGGYFSLTKNYVETIPVDFRAISVN